MILFTFAAADPQWIGWVCVHKCINIKFSLAPPPPRVAAPTCLLLSALAYPTQLTMTIILAILIVIDYMFLDDSSFIFDPNLQVRARPPATVVALAFSRACASSL